MCITPLPLQLCWNFLMPSIPSVLGMSWKAIVICVPPLPSHVRNEPETFCINVFHSIISGNELESCCKVRPSSIVLRNELVSHCNVCLSPSQLKNERKSFCHVQTRQSKNDLAFSIPVTALIFPIIYSEDSIRARFRPACPPARSASSLTTRVNLSSPAARVRSGPGTF